MLSPFAKVAPYEPEVSEGGCGPQTYLHGCRFCPAIAALRTFPAVLPRPAQGREQVIVLSLQSIQPLQLPGSFQMRGSLLGQQHEVERVLPGDVADGPWLPTLLQLLP